MSGHRNLVHYLSPFASPTWIPGWQARAYLALDDRRWSRLEELGMVSARQRAAGPPRIEQV